MKKEVTNNNVYAAIRTLDLVRNNKKISPTLRLKLVKFSKSFDAEFGEVNKVFNDIRQKYVIEDEKGKRLDVSNPDYVKEMTEFGDAKFTFEDNGITMKLFENLELSVNDMLVLELLFTNDLE